MSSKSLEDAAHLEKSHSPVVPGYTQTEGFETDSDSEDNKNGQFHRSFTPRQIHIISLGSNIGSGIFIATGKALANGGPGNIVLAYAFVGSCVWAALQTLSEMTIAFPTSGNFVDYADRWVDPSLAFGAGFAEWLGWLSVAAAEAVFFDILVQYWAGDVIPKPAMYTIFLVLIGVIFLLPNSVFAWFEYVTSLIKIVLFLLIIVLSFALIGGAGPTGTVHNGSYWRDQPVFKNGFSGFADAALLAVWAVGDQVFIGIMGGEAQSPRFSMAHATKLVPFRVNFVYLLSVVCITLLVPSDDDRLLGGSSITASPFVIAVNDAGIPGIPHILNIGMIVGIMAIGAEAIYISSRVLRTMAHQNLIPQFLAQVDKKGRPRTSLLITCAVWIVLSYINLSGGGVTVFTWLTSLTSASFFINWMIMAITSWRFHQALKAQNDGLFSEIYAWRSSKWPLAPAYLMACCLLLLACCFTAGLKPLGGEGLSAMNFFQYIIGILVIVSFTLGYKIIFRTSLRNPATADLKTGRRTLGIDEIKQLDAYYNQPTWRRFLTYVQLW